MPRSAAVGHDARHPVHRAALALWRRVLPACLLGVFLAELLVMLVLDRLHVRWGWASSLLDAALLTALILPLLYFVVLCPVGELAARLATSANAMFRAVVEAAGDAIVVGDLEGRIRYVNPAALAMLGYSREELEGADIALLVPEELRERHREGMRRYLEAGEGRGVGRGTVELEALARNGARIPVEVTFCALNAHQNGLPVAVLRDLRQRRRLGLYEALLPACCICGAIRDDDGAGHGAGDWKSLEDYVERHAAARFSHTFCPHCLEKYRREQGLAAASPVKMAS